MLDKLDEKVYRMPQPEFIELANNSRMALTATERMPIALTITWQWVIAKIGEALIARDASEIIKLVFSDLDYAQLNNNAVNDVCSVIGQPVNENTLREIQVKIDSLKELMREYLLYPQNNQNQLDYVINESTFVINELKKLEVVGIGAFIIASGLRLALLQEQAKLDIRKWSIIKDRAIEYSNYAAMVTPKLFKLSIGRIDKECRCTKWESRTEGQEKITEYECRYFDGKDLHIFRELSPNVVIECNKHRLQMFHAVADKVNQIAAKPVRRARKKWLELAASI